jgi:ClpP class serine protease
VIAAGRYKGEGVDGGPLTEEALAHRQGLVDGTYSRFLTDVAAGRGVSVDTVRSKYGEGRVLSAEAALDAGLITRIGTLGETLARYLTHAPTPAIATAQEPLPEVTAQERAALIRQDMDFARLRAKCATGSFL